MKNQNYEKVHEPFKSVTVGNSYSLESLPEILFVIESVIRRMELFDLIILGSMTVRSMSQERFICQADDDQFFLF